MTLSNRERRALAVPLGVLAGLVCMEILLLTGVMRLPIGYEGKAKIVESRIRALPGVEILDARFNRDITLEDFGFEISIDGGPSSYAYFPNAPARSVGQLLAQVDAIGSPRFGMTAYFWWMTRNLMGLSLCGVALWLGRRIVRPRRFDHCASCRYDLAGNTSGICPECGTRLS